MVLLTVVFFFLTVYAFYLDNGGLSAVMMSAMFVVWFCMIMMPDHDKYAVNIKPDLCDYEEYMQRCPREEKVSYDEFCKNFHKYAKYLK